MGPSRQQDRHRLAALDVKCWRSSEGGTPKRLMKVRRIRSSSVKPHLSAVRFKLNFEQFAVLRLAARAFEKPHETASDIRSQAMTVVPLDDGQGQIDSRSHPRRGPDVFIMDEDGVGIDAHIRKFGL